MKTIRDTDLPQLLRKMRGSLTMEQFGQLHGVTKQMISFWEMGRSQPRPEKLEQMGIRVIFSVDIE